MYIEDAKNRHRQYVGVHKKRNGKFMACVDGQSLGYFDDPRDAAKVHDLHVLKLGLKKKLNGFYRKIQQS